jgi:hypothetical protein
MLLKLDENIPMRFAGRLQDEGFETGTVLQEGLGGAGDQALLDHCVEQNRVLITYDRHFLDIRNFPPPDSRGIVVLRFSRQDTEFLNSQAPRLVALLRTRDPNGELWIIDEVHARFRGG